MKRFLHLILILVLAAGLSACRQEGKGVAPGFWVEDETVGTYPGGTPLLSGTVSGYTGLTRIDFTVDAWHYAHSIDLSNQEPKVFNYSFRLDVPADAKLPQTLNAVVTDKDGLRTEKAISLVFQPDTEAPQPIGTIIETIEVVYKDGSGLWNPTFSFTDDRALAEIRLQISVLSVDDKAACSGKEGTLSGRYTFSTLGEFPATLSATDATGNVWSKDLSLVVMPKEEEDAIQDYAQMYLFDADEEEADYLSGYFHYMDRDAACCYKANFYASHDNFHLLFAPKKTQTEDLYGASPYIPTKLMNKNGYVVPVTIEKKGYYGIYLDLMNHTFTLWDYDITSAYTGAPYTGKLWASGTGFAVGDWNYSDPMVKIDDYLYHIQMEQAAYSDARSFYFGNTEDWVTVFRCDNAGNWWYMDPANGPCCQYTSDYTGMVDMYIDTALPFGFIKIAQ